MKNWRHLALKDEELREIMEFAEKEQVSIDIAIHYLLDGGLKYYNGVSQQTRLPIERKQR